MKKKLKFIVTLIAVVIALIIGYTGTENKNPVSGETTAATQETITETAETKDSTSDETEQIDSSDTSDQADQTNISDAADASGKAYQSDVSDDADPTNTSDIREDGTYTSRDEVAEYICLYGHLPDNYITKDEAKKLGWESSEGNLGEVAPGKSIGGDHFGNYEGVLPEKSGRSYTECDIDTDGGYRGAKRIVFSNDGLIYYTEDHYETFELLYGEE